MILKVYMIERGGRVRKRDRCTLCAADTVQCYSMSRPTRQQGVRVERREDIQRTVYRCKCVRVCVRVLFSPHFDARFHNSIYVIYII
jgi:hypothetical protein